MAGDLAEYFHAGVIGIAACQPMQIMYIDGAYAYGDMIEQDRFDIDEQLRATEAEFRSAFPPGVKFMEWRSMVTSGPLAEFFASEARSTDLMISVGTSGHSRPASRRVNTGEMVMQAGRPILIIPAATEKLSMQRILVGWKNTRETRRAISDALPVLKRASHVTVVAIAAKDGLDESRNQLDDVVLWLRRHRVMAESRAAASIGDDANLLYTIAQQLDADVIVAGAYGQSRVREWALGGVTRDLLLSGSHCALISH